jgi:hypothetical protein
MRVWKILHSRTNIDFHGFTGQFPCRKFRLVKSIVCWLSFGLLPFVCEAQISNLRVKWVYPKGWQLPIDTLTIDPTSVKILYPTDSTLTVIYATATNQLQLNARQLPDSVLISYRTLPFWLGKTQFHRDPDTYDKVVYFGGTDPNRKKNESLKDKREEFFATKGIQKTGSLSRGISFGNSQNVFVNSALNLQLEGQLTDEIGLKAIISDQNVPFQPEGNTQTLQDFDKVFVQLFSKNWQLAAGDIVFRNPMWRSNGTAPSYFLRYYKNVQGAVAETNYAALGGTARTGVGLAVSKGKFASYVVQVSEGVQGPYRLRGGNNERFIIILANSERVYLDGRLLQRGFNNDYTIDYNTAEITFTTQVVVTAFSRVRVDFEYSDRNYSRSILSATHEQQLGKVRLFANYYNEKDNPRQLFSLDLSEADRRLLSQLDDQAAVGLVSGVRSIGEYTESQILYRKVDTLVNERTYTVYVNTTNAKDTLYQIQFSEVGQGNGNYERVRATTNGQVYQWVAPVNGVPQGGYDTVRTVPLPTQKRMLSTGLEFQLSRSETVYGELAFSERDLNLFAQGSPQGNTGNALKVGYANQGKRIPFLPKYNWLGSIDYERDSRAFSPIDRFRDVDFDRDWTLTDSTQTTDQIFNVAIGIRLNPAVPGKDSLVVAPQASSNANPQGLLAAPVAVSASNPAPSTSFLPSGSGDQLLYRFSHRYRTDLLNGYQHRVDIAKQLGRLQLSANSFWMYAVQPTSQASWQRMQTFIEYRGRYLAPGYAFSMDKNRIRSRTVADSVVGTAINFEENRFFLRSGDSLKARFQADYSLRQDYFPVEGRLRQNTFARTTNVNFQSAANPVNMFQFTLTYRTLENQSRTQTLPDEETVMGRMDWNGNWLNRSIRSELTIATASGRELQREFVFLPVPVGEGTHTWRDDNNDGKQDLNEFYEAINPDEKRYAKFFVPTDRYIRAFTQNLSYRLNVNPPAAWREREILLRFFSKMSSVSAWTANRKTTDDALLNRVLPFGQSVREDDVLSAQESLRSTLFYNRSNPQYGLDIGYLRTATKQLLTGRADNGNNFELRQNEEWRLNTRLNLGKQYNLKTTLVNGVRASESNFLTTRNFRIRGQQISPELAYQPTANFRIAGIYSYTYKRNIQNQENGENARIHSLATEIRWAKVAKRTVSATMRWVQIQYKGETNTPVGYELLEALQPGTNWTWNLNWQQRLANGLQITMGYDGRQSADKPVVHIGRMQVTALF